MLQVGTAFEVTGPFWDFGHCGALAWLSARRVSAIAVRSPHIVVGQRVDPAKLARAVELRHPMTPEEEILWRCLRRNQLYGFHFRRQQVIDGFIVDFYCHQVGLVIEVDGGVHASQVDYDQDRDRVLSARGLRILRVQNDSIHQDLSEVLSRITALCLSV